MPVAPRAVGLERGDLFAPVHELSFGELRC
jgi:hypothetical protein